MRVVLASVLLVMAQTGVPNGTSAQPYIARDRLPDARSFLPPPPPPGTPAQTLDQAIFVHSRDLRKSDPSRWALALSDANLKPDHVLGDFSCALGVVPDRNAVPTLYRILARAAQDSSWQTEDVKDFYARKRPYLGNDEPICVPRDGKLDHNGSYPSGHTTVGWSVALILAELAPDRSSEILARGRAFGESRVVCGVHWASDVEAGYLNAAGLVAALHSSPQFRADLQQAAKELTAASAKASSRPADAVCTAEKDAEQHSPLFVPQP